MIQNLTLLHFFLSKTKSRTLKFDAISGLGFGKGSTSPPLNPDLGVVLKDKVLRMMCMPLIRCLTGEGKGVINVN
ncbi:UNVERIFIED_CONTAM: hypothetical protein FKN15_003680 [Acipenser sinensis]